MLDTKICRTQYSSKHTSLVLLGNHQNQWLSVAPHCVLQIIKIILVNRNTKEKSTKIGENKKRNMYPLAPYTWAHLTGTHFWSYKSKITLHKACTDKNSNKIGLKIKRNFWGPLLGPIYLENDKCYIKSGYICKIWNSLRNIIKETHTENRTNKICSTSKYAKSPILTPFGTFSGHGWRHTHDLSTFPVCQGTLC